MDWTDYSDVTEKMEPAKEQLVVLDDLLSYIDSTGKDALFPLAVWDGTRSGDEVQRPDRTD